MKVKAYKQGAPGEPSFPDDYEILEKAVLQKTDLKANNNKYYAIELHRAGNEYRVYTHYGRTDDLETNPNAGTRESRYFFTNGAGAKACYDSIYREKTSPRKGYKEVSLAASNIGSHKARGTSSGHIDDKTLAKLAQKKAAKPRIAPSTLPPGVQALVSYIYDEATSALTSTVNARITANGIETPLGILTIGQIEKGEAILDELYRLFKEGKPDPRRDEEMARLSGEFYTVIPHRIGRSRSAVQEAVIDTFEEFQAKQETLQLMKDMLKVNGDGGENILFDSQIDQKYRALGCEIGWIEPGSSAFRELEDYVVRSQVKSHNVRVKHIYTLKRASEHAVFTESIGNQRLLFHGSRIKNWVGILSRGILLPKIVVSMGVNRTDAGWLGHGIYFGDAACTSTFYTTPGRKGTRLMALARVALGKTKDFTKITYGLTAPPPGYDSCHGVRRKPGVASDFDDDEWVIYRTEQQRLEYLVEFVA